MIEKDSLYEYIVIYVDDLDIAAKHPKEIKYVLMNKHRFKVKGIGPIKYHLGCDFFREEDGTLCSFPKKYVEKMVEGYITIFSTKQRHDVTSHCKKAGPPRTG